MTWHLGTDERDTSDRREKGRQKMSEFIKVILALHDGEGAAADGAEQSDNNSAESTSTITSQTRQRAGELNVDDDLLEDYNAAFGKKANTQKSNENSENTAEQEKSDTQRADFDSVFKEYKDDFTKKADEMFSERFKAKDNEIKTLKESAAKTDEVFDILALRYPEIAKGDREALINAVKNDNDIWMPIAEKQSTTVEDAKTNYEQHREREHTQEELTELRREKAARELDVRLQQVARETLQKYPDFNLQNEMANPAFRAALDFVAQRNAEQNKRNGTQDEIFDLTRAYEMAHMDELREQSVQKIGSAAMSAVSQSIASNRRPKENAGSKGGAKVQQKSIDEMSDSEFERFAEDVRAGRKHIPRG